MTTGTISKRSRHSCLVEPPGTGSHTATTQNSRFLVSPHRWQLAPVLVAFFPDSRPYSPHVHPEGLLLAHGTCLETCYHLPFVPALSCGRKGIIFSSRFFLKKQLVIKLVFFTLHCLILKGMLVVESPKTALQSASGVSGSRVLFSVVIILFLLLLNAI